MTTAAVMFAIATASCAPNSATPAQVVDAYMAAYNAADLKGVAAAFTPGAIVETPRKPIPINEVLGNYERNLFSSYPDLRTHVEARTVEGDLVDQNELVTGMEEDWRGRTTYRVRRGCITVMRTFQ